MDVFALAAASTGHASDCCLSGFKGDDRFGPAVRKDERLAHDHRLDVLVDRSSFFVRSLGCWGLVGWMVHASPPSRSATRLATSIARGQSSPISISRI